ncbi:hypothetical protein [Geodermatophilus sp. DF01-2]|uniref:hypothetical protein n=1 Tax=Geodermatophilus sp. DF01-2 TaxID=2559610 RepID=UPI0014321F26|nr:hypothetical protein [Geodermatophilus sp. DF01_2]
MTTDTGTTTAQAGPGPVAAAAVALTCAATAAGTLVAWPSPDRTTSGWQVADVPPSTAGLVVATVLICLAVAAVLVRPGSLPGRLAPAAWWAFVLASAFALAGRALYFAALAEDTLGAVIPVLDWLFTLVPALAVGLATRRAGRRTRLRAILGTAVVTLPPFALGWALLESTGGVATFLGALYSTAFLGVVPLVVAVAATRPRG